MTTYANFLKSQGASPEDIKALTEGSFASTAVKAFEAMQAAEAKAAEAERLRAIADADLGKFKTWYEKDANPAYIKMQNDLVTAQAEAARNAKLVEAARAQGLMQVAENEEAARAAAAAAAGTPPPFDTSKFVTTDSLTKLAEGVGDNLAALEDLVAEHMQLFPDRRISIRELRREAVAAGKPIDQYWEQKFNVAAARTARETATREAYEKKLRDEGASAERERLASQYGNPETRPLMPSTHPLAPRAADTVRAKQPWDADESALTRDRVTRVAKHVAEVISGGRPN